MSIEENRCYLFHVWLCPGKVVCHDLQDQWFLYFLVVIRLQLLYLFLRDLDCFTLALRVKVLQDKNTLLFEIVCQSLFLPSVSTYQLLLNLICHVLPALERDLGQHGGRAAVLFADLVASHGPQVDQAVIKLLVYRF